MSLDDNKSVTSLESEMQNYRMGVFAIAFLYVVLVLLNAGSVLLLTWLKAFGKFSALDWKSLLALAVGTGGLGAGSLVFRPIVDKLIER